MQRKVNVLLRSLAALFNKPLLVERLWCDMVHEAHMVNGGQRSTG